MNKGRITNQLLDQSIPWLVLTILAIFTYAKFFQIPYTGIIFSGARIRNLYEESDDGELNLKPGDKVIRVGNVWMKDYRNDPTLKIFQGLSAGDNIPILIEREKQLFQVDWLIPGSTFHTVFTRVAGIWWMSYVLWLAGTFTLIFHRPRNGHWIRLIAIYYLTAILILLSTGPSAWHVWHGSDLKRALIWLGMPLLLHFHWKFPRSIYELPLFIWIIFYCLCFLIAILEWFRILPINTSKFVPFIIITGSMLLLCIHYVFQTDQRKKLVLLNKALGGAFFPIILLRTAGLLGFYLPKYSLLGAFMVLPALPGAYFISHYWDQVTTHNYSIVNSYQRYLQFILLTSGIVLLISVVDKEINIFASNIYLTIVLFFLFFISAVFSFTPFLTLPFLSDKTSAANANRGEMQVRANRIISILLFFLLLGFTNSLMIVCVVVFFNNDFASILIGVAVSLSSILLTYFGYPKFNQIIEEKILGSKIPPAEILNIFVENISQNLDRENLGRKLLEIVLPNLLIRESTLLYTINNKVHVLYMDAIENRQIPKSTELLFNLRKYQGKPIQNWNRTDSYAWINLILPLEINQQIMGMWLLGRKDPDDYYTKDEITILKSIANQTAISLAKIRHQERANDLLQENLHREEEIRIKVARDLHDDILNGLVALGMTLEDSQISPGFDKQYKLLTSQIRRIISGLRPPTLDQGLWFALQDTVRDLKAHTKQKVNIDLELPYSDIRYHQNVEGQLYRIIRQACDNAIQHANAKTIRVFGNLETNKVILGVEDDGIGFSSKEYGMPTGKSDYEHYGLTLMRERADLIGAELMIKSTPGRGSSIQVTLRDAMFQKNEQEARLRVEKALQHTEAKFKTLVENANDGILVSDETGSHIYANPRAAEITGYEVRELLELSYQELAHPEEIEDIVRKLDSSRKTNPSSERLEARIITKSGGILPVEYTTAKTNWEGNEGFIIIFRDISERKLNEALIKANEEKFKAIVENANDGIMVANKFGKHIYANPRAVEITGYKEDELLKTSVKDLAEPQEYEKIINRFNSRIQGISTERQYRTKIITKNKKILPIEITAARIKWEKEEAILVILREVSKQLMNLEYKNKTFSKTRK